MTKESLILTKKAKKYTDKFSKVMLKSKIEFDWQWVPYDIYQDLISITKDLINVTKLFLKLLAMIT